ncbi:hypothetical protein [Marinobacter lutaoensis]|uniref:hypothetical protein n=1 Tax=Marinobacter lutaoensis TaxID=135739 RepID=UPI0011154B7D|nr:hypothetical protein [Marinobacter lutaoensis]
MGFSPDISIVDTRFSDLSCVWYNVDERGILTYTEVGDNVYRPLFKSVGIDIANIRSINDHRDAVQLVVADRRTNRRA